MCGISVIFNQNGIREKEIIKMGDIIKHRGPDDEGYYLHNSNTGDYYVAGGADTPEQVFQSPIHHAPKLILGEKDQKVNATIGLGHRRLSILDISPSGHQPMSDKNGRYWITYNGEIYNYIELRDELIKQGFVFHTNSDTEVIINSYIAWGIDCQHKFNGMWAFSIYDSVAKTIFFSRDRYGIKPFYYWVSHSGTFHAASEIKQFTASTEWQAVVNKDRAHDFLFYSLTDHTDETLFDKVYILKGGHHYFGSIVDLSDSSIIRHNIQKWYNYNNDNFDGNFDDACKGFSHLFKDAVEKHLRSDAPTGSALSGGLDSSAIVCYINQLLKKSDNAELQKTFSSCSNDDRYDERKWMNEVTKFTNVDGHFIYPNGEDVFSLSEKVIWHIDEPYQSQSIFLSYHVSQEAKRSKVKVMLNGQGADEYLLAYGEFRMLRWRKNLLHLSNISNLKQEIMRLGKSNFLGVIVNLLNAFIPLGIRPMLVKLTKRYRLMDSIVDNTVLKSHAKHPYLIDYYNRRTPQEISKHQISVEPLPKYLHYEDRMSMAHSVESRVPFLDYRLVEFTRKLPLEFLDGENEPKKILSNSLGHLLPTAIRYRKDKKGFITPEERWFKEDFYNEFLQLLKDNLHYAKGIINSEAAIKYFEDVRTGKIRFTYTYWHIISFCLWMKVFNVHLEYK